LKLGTNLISFSRTRTGKGVVYDIAATEDRWSFVLKEKASPDAKYFLNGRPTVPSSSGIRMEGRRNRVLITSTH